MSLYLIVIEIVITGIILLITIMSYLYKDKEAKELNNKVSISHQTAQNLEYMFYKIVEKK